MKEQDENPSFDEVFTDEAPYNHAYAVLVSELMLQQTQYVKVKIRDQKPLSQ